MSSVGEKIILIMSKNTDSDGEGYSKAVGMRRCAGAQSMTLTRAVGILQRCHLSPCQILAKAMTALEGSQQDS
jgi:hypothetical protein